MELQTSLARARAARGYRESRGAAASKIDGKVKGVFYTQYYLLTGLILHTCCFIIVVQ